MVSSPIFSLSSLSDDLPEDIRESDREASDDNESLGALPPAKRRRTMKAARLSPGYEFPSLTLPDTADNETDVSSDTTGSVPGTPRALKELSMADEETIGVDQVRNCSWDGCNVGGLANVDELVTHLNDEHVGPAKKTKFTCEWSDCKAKGKTQMSAYALRAHLRSHTKEKPFYCLLPECDRSFTRSDALAKHMRTVHETESSRTMEHYGKPGPLEGAPRTPPPQPPNNVPAKPPGRIKLVLSSNKVSAPSTPQLKSDEPYAESNVPHSPLSPGKRDEIFGPLPPDLSFTEDEVLLPRNELFRLLRRQVHWAQQESSSLQQDVLELDKKRRREWMRKELVFENALEAEFERVKRKGVIGEVRLHGAGIEVDADALLPGPSVFGEELNRTRRLEGRRVINAMTKDASFATHLPMNGQRRPWYRDPQWKNRDEHGTDSPEDDEKASGIASDEWDEEEDAALPIALEEEVVERGDDDTEVEDQ